MNGIKPRKVEAGALRRWFKEALELTTRKFFTWLVATVLFAVLCTVAALSQLLFIGIIVIAAAAILGVSYGVLIAAYADRRVSRKALLHAPAQTQNGRYTGRTTIILVRRIPLFILIMGATGVYTHPLFRGPQERSLLLTSLPLALFIFAFSVLGLLIYLALVTRDPKTHIHRFLATVLLDVSWEGSEVLVCQGYNLNRTSLTRLNLGGSSLALVAVASTLVLTLFPLGEVFMVLLGVVLFPVVSSLFYVSFRDIYLGVAENSPVKTEHRKAAPVLTS